MEETQKTMDLTQLYLKQKHLLDTFLEHGAISQEQYNKSLGDLTEKMGMQKVLENSKKNHNLKTKEVQS